MPGYVALTLTAVMALILSMAIVFTATLILTRLIDHWHHAGRSARPPGG